MDILDYLEETEDYDEYVLKMEELLKKNRCNKILLIKETFALWYILTEGIRCKNFSDYTLQTILRTNYSLIKEKFSEDADCNFILGWGLIISFWYFGDLLDESHGHKLLSQCYQMRPQNLLFKWAVRQELKLDYNEIKEIEKVLKKGFSRYYNYGKLIENYFLDLWT